MIVAVISSLVSWPMVAMVAVIMFRTPLLQVVARLVGSTKGRAKVGPIEVELGEIAQRGKEAVSTMTEINRLMAESRRLELEITRSHFASTFTDEQREELDRQIREFRSLIPPAQTYAKDSQAP